MNTIVDVSLSSSSYTVPYGKDLTSVELLMVVAFLAVLMLLVGLMVVWTCLNKVVYRIVFGVMYVVSLVVAWILSGVVVSMLLFYIKPAQYGE